ncbi:MAG: hypothetical protein K0R38_4790 [Polyangiaceae bacterium]|jgi:hypothetical protein|nr:hypothetical protein [Polyangiaceae bacterium]
MDLNSLTGSAQHARFVARALRERNDFVATAAELGVTPTELSRVVARDPITREASRRLRFARANWA